MIKPLHLLSVLASGLLLGACGNGLSLGIGLGGTLGSHIGLGTSLNIPLGGTHSGINVIEQQVVTYFDTDAQGNSPSKRPINGGYMRELISKRADGQYLVQDFYEDKSGRKRSDPMVLPKSALYNLYGHPINGSMTLYHPNGQMAEQRTYQNNALVQGQSWDASGRRLAAPRF